MKRRIFLPLLALAMILLFAGCTKATSVVQGSNREETESPRQENAPTIPEGQPSQEAELVRYPIPEDSQFYGRFDESDDAWMDANGNIWLGETQFTFDKDSTGGGEIYVNQPPMPGDPVDPSTARSNLPEFQANQMQVGRYPSDWSDKDYVYFAELDDALIAYNSNLKLQGTREALDEMKFERTGSGSVAWNNGVVSVGLFLILDPTSDEVPGKLSIMAWHTNEYDPATGELSLDWVEVFYSPDYRMIGNNSVAMPLAEQIWDALVLLDRAISLKDIETAQKYAVDNSFGEYPW